MEADKRRALRYPADFRVMCRCKEQHCEGCAINVSRGGLLVSTPELLPVGAILEISFEMPGSEPMSFKALVRHASVEGGTGIEFLEALPRYQQALAAFLERLDLECRAAAGFGG